MSSRPPPNRKQWDEYVRRHTGALPSELAAGQGAASLAADVLGAIGRLVGKGVDAVADTLQTQQRQIAELRGRESALREFVAKLDESEAPAVVAIRQRLREILEGPVGGQDPTT